MNILIAKIEAIMTGRDSTPDPFLAAFLHFLSILYGGVVRIRHGLYRAGIFKVLRLPCTVISIGNITAGGTGKTPLTLHVARLLSSCGYRTVVISRGYKGRREKRGGIVSDGKVLLMDAREAGDEPFLLATNLKDVPVVVGRNRYQAGKTAISQFDPDVIVLDDAFQHRALARDLDLVLLDYRKPLGNGHLMPRGTLREPPAALARADALIYSRADHPPASPAAPPYRRPTGPPVFKAIHQPEVAAVIPRGEAIPYYRLNTSPAPSLADLDGKNGFVFSGIARNDDFRQVVGDAGCHIKAYIEFPDHHRYSFADVKAICREAESAAADVIVTTEKDMARFMAPPSWPADLWVIRVNLRFLKQPNAFDRFLMDRFTSAHENRRQ